MRPKPTQSSLSAAPRLRPPIALAVSFLLALLALAPAAQADLVFGDTQGSGAGELSQPTSVDVDRSDGTVYVADNGNRRISVFDQDGDFLRAFGWGVDSGANALEVCTTASGCQAGIAGDAAGQFGDPALFSPSGPTRIAVDNDPASPSYRDLYALDAQNSRVQRFTPAGAFVLAFGDGVNQTTGGDVCTAASGDTCGGGASGTAAGQISSGSELDVGPGGIVHLLGDANRLQKFNPDGTLAAQLALAPAGLGSAGGLAVDSAASFYTIASGAVRKYDPAADLLITFGASFNLWDIAVDAADNAYVADVTGVDHVSRYDSAGNLLKVIYGDTERRMTSLAAYSSPTGDFFAIARAGSSLQSLPLIVRVPLPDPGPVVAPGTTEADPIGNVRATLNARINPEGSSTTYRFQYVDEASFQAEGGFASPDTVTTAESDPIGSDFGLHLASHEIPCAAPGEPGCLAPETAYRFRAIATNAAAPGGVEGPTATFTTGPPLSFGEVYATDVRITEATLHATLDPTGIPQSGYFEYVSEADYQASGFANAQKAPDVDSGAPPLDFGSGTGEVKRSVDLTGLAPDTAYRYRILATNFFGAETGPEGMPFTTFPPEPALRTDCPNQAFRTDFPAAQLPDCRAYEMVSPVDKNGADIRADPTVISDEGIHFQTSPDGSRLAYGSATAFGDARGAPFFSAYLASRDPASGWSSHGLSLPLEVPIGSPEPALNPFYAYSEDLSRAWFLNLADPQPDPAAVPGYLNLYRRHNLTDEFTAITTVTPAGNPPANPTDPGGYAPWPGGFSADGAHTVFSANGRLTASASGALDGMGRRIQQLYEHRDGAPLRLVSRLPGTNAASDQSSVAGAGPSYATGAVSEDGSVVYWTTGESGLFLPEGAYKMFDLVHTGHIYARVNGADTVEVSETVSGAEARYWSAAADGSAALFSIGEDLYRFDLAAGASAHIAAGFKGLVGASEDATQGFLVSSEVLDTEPNSVGDTAQAGAGNLYRWEAGQGFSFVAACGEVGEVCLNLHWHQKRTRRSRVSPDGRHLVFVSSYPLTGYENIDADRHERSGEVFRYSSDQDRFDCLSCNPSGARPEGKLDPPNYSSNVVVSATIPSWRQGPFHAQRVMSDDGSRVYFDSYDALLPADTNSKGDVYEWRAPGTGGCTTDHPHHFAQNGGCLALISTGTDIADSTLVEATPDGSSVFFRTGQKLVPGDPDGLVDVYAARTGGGLASQHPDPPPGPCEGEACRGASPPAPPPAGAGSAAFSGPGNPKPGPDCSRFARAAKRSARQAKRLRSRSRRLNRAARRSSNPRRSKAARRKAARLGGAAKKRSRAARKQAGRAKRCRRAAR